MTADLFASNGVTPHGHPLLLSQFAGLEKDGVRDSHFPDIVQITPAVERQQTHARKTVAQQQQ